MKNSYRKYPQSRTRFGNSGAKPTKVHVEIGAYERLRASEKWQDLNPNKVQQGVMAELQVALDLLARGYEPYLPMPNARARYDLLAVDPESKLIFPVSVKSASGMNVQMDHTAAKQGCVVARVSYTYTCKPFMGAEKDAASDWNDYVFQEEVHFLLQKFIAWYNEQPIGQMFRFKTLRQALARSKDAYDLSRMYSWIDYEIHFGHLQRLRQGVYKKLANCVVRDKEHIEREQPEAIASVTSAEPSDTSPSGAFQECPSPLES